MSTGLTAKVRVNPICVSQLKAWQMGGVGSRMDQSSAATSMSAMPRSMSRRKRTLADRKTERSRRRQTSAAATTTTTMPIELRAIPNADSDASIRQRIGVRTSSVFPLHVTASRIERKAARAAGWSATRARPATAAPTATVGSVAIQRSMRSVALPRSHAAPLYARGIPTVIRRDIG